jgi:lipoprotein signal peptidase
VTARRTALVVFLFALAFDLVVKAIMVAHEDTTIVVYNARDGRYASRVLLSLVAVLVTYGLSRASRWRGYGEVWGAWVGVGLLVAGVLANGVSRFLWARGVPDFIFAGDHIWNLADFMIGIGMTGGILSLFPTVLLAYVRGRIQVARP